MEKKDKQYEDLNISRRNIIRLGTAGMLAAAVTGLPTVARTAHAETGDQRFAVLRERWVQMVTGGDFDATQPEIAAQLTALDAAVAELLATLDTSANRTDLWPQFPLSGDGMLVNARESYQQLFVIATAWRTTGAAIFEDAAVGEQVASALRHLHDNVYNSDVEAVGNWWEWEIGIPRRLMDTCALMHAAIPAADRTAYTAAVGTHSPDPNWRGKEQSYAETGANRVDKALATTVRGIVAEDAAVLELARDSLSDVANGNANSIFQYVNWGDGFYADGSFRAHLYIPYVGTYGTVALWGVARLFGLLGGSDWEIVDPNSSVIIDAPEESFAPFMWNGLMMDTVRGRAVARMGQDYTDGFAAMNAILTLAAGLEPELRERYESMVKGWMQRSPKSYMDWASIPQIARAVEVLSSDVPAAPEPVGHRQFPDQDRFVHRRPGWAFTVSISTHRTGRYEWGNGENLAAWYQGDGMTYMYLDNDLEQFSDNFWPTVYPYALPGTTLSLETRARKPDGATSVPRSTRWWGGGTSIGERFGTFGVDHLAENRNLLAKKSWFLLDDVVVALGANITATNNQNVETVVENRHLHASGMNALVVDDQELVPGLGDSDTRTDPQWAHLDGVAGYLFPDGGLMVTSRQQREGTWRYINDGSGSPTSEELIRRNYLLMVLRHGHNPQAASYHYAILPGAGLAATRARALERGYSVLANTVAVQAIDVDTEEGPMVMANFFAAGVSPQVEATGSCSVIAWRHDDMVEIALSDPQRLSELVTITFPEITDVRQVQSLPDGVTVTSYLPLTLEVDFTGTLGTTRTVVLDAQPGPAQAAPAAGVLSSTSGWDDGLRDGSYEVRMDLWWGDNAHTLRLYEDDQLIAQQALTDATPAAQAYAHPVTGRANGTYRYRAELENQHGVTETRILEVEVTQADPAVPVLDVVDQGGGQLRVTMNLWWGTNATAYRLLLDDEVADERQLVANSPQAQQAVSSLQVGPGRHRLVAELGNAAGTSRSATKTVVINDFN